ncbi:MAG: extracellular solute-binding protein, partial [Clostridia bacterium]|nr:extracellular solute-binding protein [Clostridia bacterium]
INTIRFEVVLGDMSAVLSTVENSLAAINGYYRKILMITGPGADEYRDYGFNKLIPDVLKGLKTEAANLKEVSDELTRLMGEKGEHSSTLDRVSMVCERMGTYPDTVASQMKTLKDYSASLGTWLSDTQNQPLDIDYITIQAVDAELPQAEPGFFGNLWYEVQKFYQSFFSDYNSLGSVEETGDTAGNVNVEVWTATSRDQAQIIRSLVDDNFTPNYEGITVEIKLVAGGTLLPATLAGTGPDVYLGAAQGDPVNYAIRSAVLSLNSKTGDTSIGYDFTDLENSVWNSKNDNGEYKYPAFHRLIEAGTIKDFDEVTGWFADQAMVPVTLYGETYALPMTMSFSMMFYRKDIFVELGIEVPNTWDDFYDIIYSLQSNSLDIGFPSGTGGSMILMYQQNEPLYDMGDHDYYLELFRRYYYEGDDYDNISAEQLAEVDKAISDAGLTYIDEEGNTIPKTDGMTINLDSDISLATFKEVCQLFTMYSFPVTYEFANRFRSGEMPLAIVDYTSYNTLIIFAPEINGLWEFTPLPGTANELTQEINNVTIGGISTVMMMNSVSDNEEEALGAWAFMQWYLGADIQSAYGNEMVALLGPSAKQPTANINALADMAWSTEEYNNLFSQFKAVACTPEFPGSYIIGRYTNFAFLDVYNNDAEPVDELQSQIVDINVELSRKREEFGLPTSDSIKLMQQQVEEKYPDWEGGFRK